jgi:Flp pilus assembly protein TadG
VIAGWLAKIVVVIALLGFAAVELGSPLWTRAQLDGIAHDAADEAARILRDTNDFPKAEAAAKKKAEDDKAVATVVSRVGNDKVSVTVFREAKSYVLHNFGPTKDWYDVTVTASADLNLR